MWPPTRSLVYAIVHVGRLLPPASPLCAVHVSGTKIKKIIFSLLVIDALCAVRASGAINKDKTINITHALCSVELFKSITCEKLRRATKAAAAARFFDESVRNSYARRATTPQTASWRQGEFRAEARKRSRRCGNGVAQPSQTKTRAFLFGGRAALAVRNKRSPRKHHRANAERLRMMLSCL